MNIIDFVQLIEVQGESQSEKEKKIHSGMEIQSHLCSSVPCVRDVGEKVDKMFSQRIYNVFSQWYFFERLFFPSTSRPFYFYYSMLSCLGSIHLYRIFFFFFLQSDLSKVWDVERRMVIVIHALASP